MTRRPLYIREKQILDLIREKTSFDLAKKTFALMARGKAQMPPKIYLHLTPENDFRAMPAFIGDACGIKWISVFPSNRKYHLPTVNGQLFLNSVKTGELLAIVEANALTALRTAGAAVLASVYMANPKPKKLALVGAGLQAGYQLKAHCHFFKFQEIAVWGFNARESHDFCQKFRPQVRSSYFHASASIETCISDADIIITTTPSRKPLIKKRWLRSGVHINAIGADAKGKQELEASILKNARVVVDEWTQAVHSGEVNVPIARGQLWPKEIYSDLASIVAGKRLGRLSPKECTVFDSTGLAVLDIQFAAYAYRRLSLR